MYMCKYYMQRHSSHALCIVRVAQTRRANVLFALIDSHTMYDVMMQLEFIQYNNIT